NMESVTTENLKVKISANYNFTLDVDNKKYSRRSDFKICEILQSSIKEDNAEVVKEDDVNEVGEEG
ncbi:8241_t:CDS:2, partial [Entrophospora sp. SA101]